MADGKLPMWRNGSFKAHKWLFSVFFASRLLCPTLCSSPLLLLSVVKVT